MKHISM